MKFLVDNALSPTVARLLQEAGYDAIHVRDIGLATAADPPIFDEAQRQGRTVVSIDTDFGTLLALRKERHPSVVLFRGAVPRRPEPLTRLLLANLESCREWIERGAVIVIEPTRIRVRPLPIGAEPQD